MSARVVMLGMPGAGKGTQSVRLAERLQVPPISTGEIFRSNMARHTHLGDEVEKYISRGHLVPDSVTNDLVFDRLSQPDARDGFLLDGYPRTVEQAEALRDWLADQGLHLDVVIELIADHDEVIDRLMTRAHLENRQDDTESVVLQRLEVYESQTRPLHDFYEKYDLLVQINGVGRVEEVTERMLDQLAKLEHRWAEDAKGEPADTSSSGANQPNE